MKLLFGCAWWGLDHLGIECMLHRIKDAGFDAVEMYVPQTRKEIAALRRALNKVDLVLIVHHFTAGGKCPKQYALSFRELLLQAASLEPLLINSHTGKDTWSYDDNLQLFGIAEAVTRETGVPIVHETHRGRALFCGPVTRRYLEAMPSLRINADFSHWANVHESLMEDQFDTMQLSIERADYIHARVGHAQGPQVGDPRGPRWMRELSVFTSWWQRIVERHVAGNRTQLVITPEFGPPPYTAHLPFSCRQASNAWEVNVFMKQYLKAIFNPLLSHSGTVNSRRMPKK
jgi:sugar phosphate isomerase/epimerase